MERKLITFSEIYPDFYVTPAMCNVGWKENNCKDRYDMRYAYFLRIICIALAPKKTANNVKSAMNK